MGRMCSFAVTALGEKPKKRLLNRATPWSRNALKTRTPRKGVETNVFNKNQGRVHF
jgi:hypothetical protein